MHKKIRFVVGVLEDTMTFTNVKVIPVDDDKDMEFASNLYQKITGNDGVRNPIYVIAKVDERGLDIYDDALYYAERDSRLKDLLYSLV